LIALFGISANAQEDVSVSHWRYGDKLVLKDSSVFSLHHRTRLFDAKNIQLTMACPYVNPDLNGPLITACPEPVYQVNKGQAVNLELSYENAGKTSPIAVAASYYLSFDNKIDETDTLLKTSRLSIKRDSKPSTISTKLSIPKTVVSGNHYWLGCHISPSRGALKESNENNN
jgi:hypothetical protein